VSLSAAGELASRYALLLIVCGGAALRFATLGTQGFWYDEWVTIDVVTQGPADLLQAIPVSENNPPLYYLLAGGWERVFGSGEVGLRSLSALLGTATIPVVYAAGAFLSSRSAGLVAAGLTATNPMLIWYSQEARNYMLVVLLAALSFLFFVRALREGSVRWLFAWTLASALALSNQYLAIVLIAPEAAWLLWRRRGSRAEIALATGAVGVVGLALLPLAASQGGPAWIARIDLGERLLRVPEHLLVGLNAPWPILPALVGAGVAAVFVYALIRSDETARRVAALAGGVALVGGAIVLLVAIAGYDFLITRNLLQLWAPVGVALGVALGARTVGPLGPAATVGLCVLGVALVVWTAATPAAQRPDWGELAAKLGDPQQERVIVSQTTAADLSDPLLLYLDGARRAAPYENHSSSVLAVVAARPVSDYGLGPCWWGGICGGGDPQPFEVPPGFELAGEGSTARFEYRLYRAPAPIEVPISPQADTAVFVQAPP
jgi:mannosyltransferase